MFASNPPQTADELKALPEHVPGQHVLRELVNQFYLSTITEARAHMHPPEEYAEDTADERMAGTKTLRVEVRTPDHESRMLVEAGDYVLTANQPPVTLHGCAMGDTCVALPLFGFRMCSYYTKEEMESIVRTNSTGGLQVYPCVLCSRQHATMLLHALETGTFHVEDIAQPWCVKTAETAKAGQSVYHPDFVTHIAHFAPMVTLHACQDVCAKTIVRDQNGVEHAALDQSAMVVQT
jgi:hypothetical protein